MVMELLCFKPISSLEQYSLRQHCPIGFSVVMKCSRKPSLGKQAANENEGEGRYKVRKVGKLGLHTHVQRGLSQ